MAVVVADQDIESWRCRSLAEGQCSRGQIGQCNRQGIAGLDRATGTELNRPASGIVQRNLVNTIAAPNAGQWCQANGTAVDVVTEDIVKRLA